VPFSFRLARTRRSFAGAAFFASALVHAAAFVAFGPLASSGVHAPVVPAGPVIVHVTLAPWPAEIPAASNERDELPVAGASAPRRARTSSDRRVFAPVDALASPLAEGLSTPVVSESEGPTLAPPSPVTVALAPARAPSGAATPPALVPAAYLRTPEPAYPVSAREEGEEGVVLLRVRISRSGQPEEIVLDRSSGFPALDRAAIAGVKRWSFTPARRGDEPIEAWMQVPIRFRLG
jgi:protein TonB